MDDIPPESKLQDKYGELTAANYAAGAVEQQEAAQIAAGFAQQERATLKPGRRER